MAGNSSFGEPRIGSGAAGLAAPASSGRAGRVAPRKGLLQVGDRTGHAITKQLREAVEGSTITVFQHSPLHELEPSWRARCGDNVIEASTVVLAAGGRCYREAEERGELTTNH